MATIVARRTAGVKITYQAKVRLDGHPPVSRSFTSKAAARAWSGEIEADMRNGRYAAGSGRNLSEAIAGYRAERLPELRDQRTARIHLDWWDQRLGCKRLCDLSVMAVSDAMAELAQQPKSRQKPINGSQLRSAATLNRYKATLSAILQWAQRRVRSAARTRKTSLCQKLPPCTWKRIKHPVFSGRNKSPDPGPASHFLLQVKDATSTRRAYNRAYPKRGANGMCARHQLHLVDNA